MLTVDYSRLGVASGDSLLDVGCGAGRHAYEAVRLGARVVAYDLDASSVKETFGMLEAVGGGSAVNGDVLRLPFASSSFDRVIAAEVLEHVPADRTALMEISRIVRPGGTVAVTVPRWGPELLNWALSDEYHSVPGGHIRIYRASALAARMGEAGFTVTGRGYAHALHTPYWWLRCAVGVSNETHPLVRLYRGALEYDIVHRPFALRVLDSALNPVMGKSMVLYGTRRAS